MNKCTLSPDINTCPYFNRETSVCENENKCSLQKPEDEDAKSEYQRPERWYKKYYDNEHWKWK